MCLWDGTIFLERNTPFHFKFIHFVVSSSETFPEHFYFAFWLPNVSQLQHQKQLLLVLLSKLEDERGRGRYL